jgi:mono/diheme cytochrome c family protein
MVIYDLHISRMGSSLIFFTATVLLLSGCTHLRYGFASNPLENTTSNLAAGRVIYEKECSSCHGTTGMGDGRLVRDLPVLPTALATAQREWSDGVFHIRMIGKPKNGMPSFRDSLSENDRWMVITYVRSLGKE